MASVDPVTHPGEDFHPLARWLSGVFLLLGVTMLLAGILLDFVYDEDRRVCGVTASDDDETTREWLLAALVPGARKVADLPEEWHADDEDPPTDAVLRLTKAKLGKALQRMRRDGAVLKAGDNRGATWSPRYVSG